MGVGSYDPGVTAPETEAELLTGLAALLAGLDQGGERPRVDGVRRLSGGASRETWAFTATAEGQPARALILQRIRGGLTLDGTTLEAEDGLLAAAARAGVPVPEVVADSAACQPFLGDARLTAHVDGEALGPRIVRHERYAEARTVLARQCGRALAGIHAIDPADAPGLTVVDPLDQVRVGLDLVDEHRPAFELALRWLADHRPAAGTPGVVHGDFRVGNLLVDETGLRAVLDWELAHLGDPLEDLGWLCVRAWRFGGDGVVGGVGDLDDLLDGYAEVAGTRPDAEAVRWWIVAGTLRWGLICAVQARRHLDGHVRSVELATIGRRVCETEYDLLQLLDVSAPDPAPDDPTGDGDRAGADQAEAPAADAHGRPTAAELVAAVREHLADVLAPGLTGAAAFQVKVAGNALGIVERELVLGSALAAARAERLAALGVADEPELAAGLRTGTLAPSTEVLAAVRAAVVDRLRVANPRWLQPPDRP